MISETYSLNRVNYYGSLNKSEQSANKSENIQMARNGSLNKSSEWIFFIHGF